MATLVKTPATLTVGHHKLFTDAFWQRAEENRFGLIVAILLTVGCSGGIAAAFGAGASTMQIAAVVFPTILTLATVLAVTPMRLIVTMMTLALICDILVLMI